MGFRKVQALDGEVEVGFCKDCCYCKDKLLGLSDIQGKDFPTVPMAALGIESSLTCIVVKAFKQTEHILLGASSHHSSDWGIRPLIVPTGIDGYKAVMTSDFHSWGVVKERMDNKAICVTCQSNRTTCQHIVALHSPPIEAARMRESKEEKFEKVLNDIFDFNAGMMV